MGIFLGIVSLLLLSFGAELYRREKARQARAPFVGYVHFRNAGDIPWEYLHPKGFSPDSSTGGFIAEIWFDSLEDVVTALRSHPLPDRIYLAQSDGTSVRLPFDPLLSDKENGEAIRAAIM